MAIGFMKRHSSGVAAAMAAAVAILLAGLAVAAEFSVVGVIGDKAAVLVIDGAAPRTVRVGQSLNGVTVIAVTKQGATLEFDGKRRALALGQHLRGEASVSGGAGSVTLAADSRGHFVTDAQVNG